MEDLKISIIMPSYNQGLYIDYAIKSILSQSYQNKELIIIDGGSTDNSVSIIKKYSDKIDWISEPDLGQSNAINKGFEKATGQLLTWSNADDILLPDSLKLAAMTATSIKSLRQRWIVGGCFWLNPCGLLLRCSHARSWNEKISRLGLVSVYSPSSFFSREILDEVGYLDESFDYAMDTELWLRLTNHGIKYKASNSYFWGLRLHPNSKVSGNLFNKNISIDIKRKNESQKIKDTYSILDKDLKLATSIHRLNSLTSLRFWQDRINELKYQNKPWQLYFSDN